jgi:RNA polymerase-binding protein DksA
MTPRDREELRRALQQRASAILARTHDKMAEAAEMPAVRTEVEDIGDESLRDAALATRADLDERDRTLLVLIREAFERMRDGSYGACVECGAEIPVARLRALPWAARCAEDQERVENEQRAAGRDPSPTL